MCATGQWLGGIVSQTRPLSEALQNLRLLASSQQQAMAAITLNKVTLLMETIASMSSDPRAISKRRQTFFRRQSQPEPEGASTSKLQDEKVSVTIVRIATGKVALHSCRTSRMSEPDP